MNKNKISKRKISEIKKYFIKEKEKITSAFLSNDNGFIENVGGDEGDAAQANIINYIQETLSKRDLARLKKINYALEKIEKSDFGLCEECSELISEKRLLAIPGCNYCLPCAEIEEKINKINYL